MSFDLLANFTCLLSFSIYHRQRIQFAPNVRNLLFGKLTLTLTKALSRHISGMSHLCLILVPFDLPRMWIHFVFYAKPFLNCTKLSSLINLENHENLFKSDLLFQSCDHHVNKITQLDRWKSRIIILVISSILMLTSDISWLRNELFVASCQSLFQYLKASKVCF